MQSQQVPADSGSGDKTSQRYVMGDSQQIERQPVSSTKGHYLSHFESVTVDITRYIILIMHGGYSDKGVNMESCMGVACIYMFAFFNWLLPTVCGQIII